MLCWVLALALAFQQKQSSADQSNTPYVPAHATARRSTAAIQRPAKAPSAPEGDVRSERQPGYLAPRACVQLRAEKQEEGLLGMRLRGAFRLYAALLWCGAERRLLRESHLKGISDAAEDWWHACLRLPGTGSMHIALLLLLLERTATGLWAVRRLPRGGGVRLGQEVWYRRELSIRKPSL